MMNTDSSAVTANARTPHAVRDPSPSLGDLELLSAAVFWDDPVAGNGSDGPAVNGGDDAETLPPSSSKKLGVNSYIAQEWQMFPEPERYHGLGLPNFVALSLAAKVYFMQQHFGFKEYGPLYATFFATVSSSMGAWLLTRHGLNRFVGVFMTS